MKLLPIIFLCVSGTLFGQTALIAHKSHSGTVATFAFADPGNFGEPPAALVKVSKLNDTTFVMQMDQWANHRIDTVYNHPVLSDPNMTVDSMRQFFFRGEQAVFENFEPKVKPDSAAVKTKAQSTDKVKVPETKKTTKAPVKKKGFLLLWIIGGGTFIGMLFLTRKRKSRTIQYS